MNPNTYSIDPEEVRAFLSGKTRDEVDENVDEIVADEPKSDVESKEEKEFR